MAVDDAFATWWSPSEAPTTERPSFTGYPFTLGVASGEPLSSGVVLWTRLAPEPLNGGGVGPDPVDVGWELAEDEGFGRVVQRGIAVASAAWAHSVHVEVSGLEPAHWYFYRFIAGGEVSPVGRTRTAPATAEPPGQLRFGLASCQHFEQGYYAAHRHLTAEDLDLMVFVGDYPDLQRLHAAVPWVVTWDDHEVDNNYAGARSEALEPDSLGGAPRPTVRTSNTCRFANALAQDRRGWRCAPVATGGGLRGCTCSTAASDARHRPAHHRAEAVAR